MMLAEVTVPESHLLHKNKLGTKTVRDGLRRKVHAEKQRKHLTLTACTT